MDKKWAHIKQRRFIEKEKAREAENNENNRADLYCKMWWNAELFRRKIAFWPQPITFHTFFSHFQKDSTIKHAMSCSHWINNRLKLQPVFMWTAMKMISVQVIRSATRFNYAIPVAVAIVSFFLSFFKPKSMCCNFSFSFLSWLMRKLIQLSSFLL